MKDEIVFKTKIGLNSGSYRTSIPKEISELFELKKGSEIKWLFDHETKEITLILENTEKTSSNIDEVIEKEDKTDESDELIEKNNILLNTTTDNNIFQIIIDDNIYKKIIIRCIEKDSQVTTVTLKGRSNNEIKQIISEIKESNCKTKDEMKEFIDKYRPITN